MNTNRVRRFEDEYCGNGLPRHVIVGSHLGIHFSKSRNSKGFVVVHDVQ